MRYSTAWFVLHVCIFICLADAVRSGVADDEENVRKTRMMREYNGTCGEGLTWVFSEGTLTISGTGEMTNFKYSVPLYSYGSDITTIVIEYGVSTIGDNAFFGADAMNVTIPDSVKTIGNYAFYNCRHLESVFIPDSVTHIGNSSFSQSGVKNVTIPGSVKTIGDYAFSGCHDLESVFISDGVATIRNSAFYSSGVKNVTIPGSVKTIGDYAFYYSSLESVFIPDSVESIGTAAFSCNSLTVFYQGTLDLFSEDIFLWGTVDVICVPQTYNSSTFCGVNVTSDEDICKRFQSMFTYCSKPVYINGDFILEDNGCEKHICLKEECKKDVYVELELREIIDDTEVDVGLILLVLEEDIGIETSDILIGWDSDESGEIIRVMIYVDDEATAYSIADTINNRICIEYAS